MAGARGRKLDLSALIQGGHNVASILSNVDESGGVAGLLNGISGGISKYGANRREDKQRAEAKAERESVRAEDRAYRAKRDAFSDSLALKADARAERDQSIQEDEYKRKVAAEAKAVEETTHLLSRAQVAGQTGMPMDPKVLEGIQRQATVIQAAGGVNGIMARAAALEEPDVEGLIAQTSKYESLATLLTQQMGREKNPARHAALGDAFMQLGSIVDANKYRIRLHEANTKRKMAVEETTAKAAAEAAVKAQSEKADLDAFNADLKANGQPPVSSLEFGKMRERERVGDERARENIDLKREKAERDRVEFERQQAETERKNRATEAANAAVLEIRQSAERRAQGKAGFDVEAEIDKGLDKRIDDARAAMTATDQAWYRLVGTSPKDPERAELAAKRQHYETLLGTLMTEREKRAEGRLGAPSPVTAPEKPWSNDPAYKALTPEKRAEFDAAAKAAGK